MNWVFLAIGTLVASFSFVLLFGAPYLPTRKDQVAQALKLLDLKKGQLLLELGAGSGGLTIAAAKNGIRVKAYELNPLLALVLRIRTRKFGDSVQIMNTNFWNKELCGADGVFVFLLDRYMARLDKKLAIECAGAKLVSYSFKVPGKKVSNQLGPMYLYKY